MMRAGRLFGASVAAVLVWATLAPAREALADSVSKDALYVPGEVVVVFRDRGRLTNSVAQARALARRVGGRVARVSTRSRSAVIRAGAETDVRAMARRFSGSAGVRFAEPNYIYRATGVTAGVSAVTAAPSYVVRRAPGTARKAAVSKAALRSMRTRTGATIKATYPSDKLLWDNGGWDWVGASIVWGNTTASKNVCVIDTGVDYLHTDLTTARVIKGRDCVNEDTDPMDDNGHGTLVAGIIAAKQNNTEGIAGVSPTAKVVAMKALNADGWGSNFDIAQAINECAKRTDVSIINLSFGGPYSKLQESAVLDATYLKGKLVVASAGNDSSDMPYCTAETIASATGDTNNPMDALKAGVRSYPAGFATASQKYSWDGSTCVAQASQLHPKYPAVLSVAAGGSGSDFDYSCRAEYSNYGEWVNITAPGTDILSTTPWDKPFTMNAEEGFAARYDYMSGSSMAAAFVSGVTARAWGYLALTQPLSTNVTVADYVKYIGFDIVADDACWPSSMSGVADANVAAALDRGALMAEAYDAVTGLPLIGASIQAFQGSPAVLKATATLTAITTTSTDYPAGYLTFPGSVDLINLPADGAPTATTLKVNKSGYTSAATNAFVGGDDGAVKADGTIDVPRGWWGYAGYAAVPPRSANFTAVSAWDLWEERSAPWLTTQLPVDDVRGNFIVGYDVCGDTSLEGETAGQLSVFPFAQAVYENWVETHQIVPRKALPALPYYPGEYMFRVYNADKDFDTRQGSFFLWKDGVLKGRVDMTDSSCDVAGHDWWEAAAVSSRTSGSITFTPKNKCTDTASIAFPTACGP
jgi:subtilisin family serine protease